MSEMRNKKTQGNQSVEKAFQIVELLVDANEPMRLLDISKSLEVNSSTALRFLSSLVKCGYAAQDPETSRYHLTFKFCAIAGKINEGNSIRDIAAPYMKQLSKIFSESVCLAIEQDMRVVYIYVVNGSGLMIRSMQRIGNIAPLHCTGIGKLFLTEYSEEQIDRLIQTRGLEPLTPNTITTKTTLKEELKQIEQRGYAFDNEECEISARCVAFPLRNHSGRIIAGLSVTGPSARLTTSLINEKINDLTSIGNQISQKLGYNIGI